MAGTTGLRSFCGELKHVADPAHCDEWARCAAAQRSLLSFPACLTAELAGPSAMPAAARGGPETAPAVGVAPAVGLAPVLGMVLAVGMAHPEGVAPALWGALALQGSGASTARGPAPKCTYVIPPPPFPLRAPLICRGRAVQHPPSQQACDRAQLRDESGVPAHQCSGRGVIRRKAFGAGAGAHDAGALGHLLRGRGHLLP